MGIGTTENAGQDINEFRPRLEFMAFTFAAQMWQAQVCVCVCVCVVLASFPSFLCRILSSHACLAGVDGVGLVRHGCGR
jgi:hypothetical protein